MARLFNYWDSLFPGVYFLLLFNTLTIQANLPFIYKKPGKKVVLLYVLKKGEASRTEQITQKRRPQMYFSDTIPFGKDGRNNNKQHKVSA